MTDHTGENLRRVMTRLGLSMGQVAEQTGLDRRTIQGILDGRSKPHAQTLHQLAERLGVASDELFLDPSQLIYRRFDRQTNPAVDEVVSQRPELFAGWSEADFDELFSRVGTGGPLTAEGAVAAVERMNRNRGLHEKLAVLLETGHADVIRGVVEALYESIVARAGTTPPRTSPARRSGASPSRPLAGP